MQIAESAASVLPSVVNQFLVADPADPATVQIIDPPGEPTRSRPNQILIIAVLTIVSVAVGAAIAIAAEGWSAAWAPVTRVKSGES